MCRTGISGTGRALHPLAPGLVPWELGRDTGRNRDGRPDDHSRLEQAYRPQHLQQHRQDREPDHGLDEPRRSALPAGEQPHPQPHGRKPERERDRDEAGEPRQVRPEAQQSFGSSSPGSSKTKVMSSSTSLVASPPAAVHSASTGGSDWVRWSGPITT